MTGELQVYIGTTAPATTPAPQHSRTPMVPRRLGSGRSPLSCGVVLLLQGTEAGWCESVRDAPSGPHGKGTPGRAGTHHCQAVSSGSWKSEEGKPKEQEEKIHE